MKIGKFFASILKDICVAVIGICAVFGTLWGAGTLGNWIIILGLWVV
jgi:hypothetical protein